MLQFIPYETIASLGETGGTRADTRKTFPGPSSSAMISFPITSRVKFECLYANRVTAFPWSENRGGFKECGVKASRRSPFKTSDCPESSARASEVKEDGIPGGNGQCEALQNFPTSATKRLRTSKRLASVNSSLENRLMLRETGSR